MQKSVRTSFCVIITDKFILNFLFRQIDILAVKRNVIISYHIWYIMIYDEISFIIIIIWNII